MNNFIYDIPLKIYFNENQLVHIGIKKYFKYAYK